MTYRTPGGCLGLHFIHDVLLHVYRRRPHGGSGVGPQTLTFCVAEVGTTVAFWHTKGFSTHDPCCDNAGTAVPAQGRLQKKKASGMMKLTGHALEAHPLAQRHPHDSRDFESLNVSNATTHTFNSDEFLKGSTGGVVWHVIWSTSASLGCRMMQRPFLTSSCPVGRSLRFASVVLSAVDHRRTPNMRGSSRGQQSLIPLGKFSLSRVFRLRCSADKLS